MTSGAFTKSLHIPNQDNFILDEKLGLFAVFDGIGGHKGGTVASKIAAQVVLQTFNDKANTDKKATAEILKTALTKAAEEIVKDGAQNGRADQGTTATVVKIDQNEITIANIGDSRCYGLTGENKLKKLTKDNSMLEDLVKSRYISGEVAEKIDQAKSKKELTGKGLLVFYSRNVLTAALLAGFKPEDIFFARVKSEKFKALLLITDGLHNNLTDEEIETLIIAEKNPKNIAKFLVNCAYQKSVEGDFRSKHDDITAVVVKF